MKRLLREFSHEDAYCWFETHGVPLTTQEDECVFPQSQNSESVILCLKREAESAGVEIRTGCPVQSIERSDNGGLQLVFDEGATTPCLFDRVALTTGGAPRGEGHDWLSALGHKIEKPCPSLYTFNINTPYVDENNVMKYSKETIGYTIIDRLWEVMRTVAYNQIIVLPYNMLDEK
jgi:predicted flavoprotein YhiN